MNGALKAYMAELFGTFTLVFVGTAVATLTGGLLTGYGDTGWLGISLAFGGTLMILVNVIGPVSGCHLNPAVTLAMAIAGRMEKSRVPGYVLAQCAGAILASVVLLALLKGMPGYALATHGLGANGNPRGMTTVTLLGWELVMSTLFVFTIFAATRKGFPAGATALTIGGFLFIAHLAGAQLGDASLNPARSLGPALLQGGAALKILWVFVVGPLVGGGLGLGLYRLLYDAE